jgi:predicted transcriptional regulator
MTGIDALKKYMAELEWSAADLANHCTVVDLSTITGLLSGDVVPSYIPMMHIINKLCTQFPSDRHWGIYQSIMVAPIFTTQTTKAKQ